MKTKNAYSYPVERKNIQKIIPSNGPAHKRYHSEVNDADILYRNLFKIHNQLNFL